MTWSSWLQRRAREPKGHLFTGRKTFSFACFIIGSALLGVLDVLLLQTCRAGQCLLWALV